MLNVFKFYSKDTRTVSIDIVLVYLLLSWFLVYIYKGNYYVQQKKLNHLIRSQNFNFQFYNVQKNPIKDSREIHNIFQPLQSGVKLHVQS